MRSHNDILKVGGVTEKSFVSHQKLKKRFSFPPYLLQISRTGSTVNYFVSTMSEFPAINYGGYNSSYQSYHEQRSGTEDEHPTFRANAVAKIPSMRPRPRSSSVAAAFHVHDDTVAANALLSILSSPTVTLSEETTTSPIAVNDSSFSIPTLLMPLDKKPSPSTSSFSHYKVNLDKGTPTQSSPRRLRAFSDLTGTATETKFNPERSRVKFVGIYSPGSRRKRIRKFMSKRKARVWGKRVEYNVRKDFADSRLRVKGRFVKKEDECMVRMAMELC